MDDSLARLIGTYLDHLNVERGLSTHTLSAYRRDLERYADYLAGRGVTTWADATAELISEHTAELRAGGLAPASVARAVVAIRNLHRFALAEGATGHDAARDIAPPRPPTRLPKALALDQVQAMLDTPDPTSPLGLRDAALLELLYGTGARVSEAVGLDVDDVSRQVQVAPGAPTPALRLFGKGSKERIVPLGSYARAAISAYLIRARPELAGRAGIRSGAGMPALFLNARGGRLSRQSAWTIISTAAERAGISTEVSPHTLRHSFATHLLDGGADVRVVQELLGHASVTTTQIYTLVTVDHLREVYLVAHPRAR